MVVIVEQEQGGRQAALPIDLVELLAEARLEQVEFDAVGLQLALLLRQLGRCRRAPAAPGGAAPRPGARRASDGSIPCRNEAHPGAGLGEAEVGRQREAGGLVLDLVAGVALEFGGELRLLLARPARRTAGILLAARLALEGVAEAVARDGHPQHVAGRQDERDGHARRRRSAELRVPPAELGVAAEAPRQGQASGEREPAAG